MLDFIAEYGGQILAIITGAAGTITALYSLKAAFKTGKKVDENNKKTNTEIQITREGIVEAFKTAKIPTEWKISVSNQVIKILNEFREEFITKLQDNLSVVTAGLAIIAKTLSFTAASNKLTEDEKNKLLTIANLISEKDSTIDITE